MFIFLIIKINSAMVDWHSDIADSKKRGRAITCLIMKS